MPVLMGPPLVIRDATAERFRAGGTDIKEHIVGVDEGGAPVSYIARPYTPEFMKNWSAFKLAGLGVPEELHWTDDERLLLTDVKADGSETYGRNMVRVMQRDLVRTRPRPEIDELFVELLTGTARQAIIASVNDYVFTAKQHHIVLPTDDPAELVVHPDNTWELMTLDLTRGRVLTPKEQQDWHYGDILNASNNRVMAQFTLDLNYLTNYMMTEQAMV